MEDNNAGNFRKRLLEKFQLFYPNLRAQKRQAGDVTTGPRKASNKPVPDGVSDCGHDNRDRASRFLRGSGRA